MSLNRWVNGILVALVLIWGGLSVEAAREQLEQAAPVAALPAENSQNKSVQNLPKSVDQKEELVPLKSVHNPSTPKPTSSAEAVVRNLLAGRLASPAPTSTPTHLRTLTPTPTALPTAQPPETPAPTPSAQVSYQIYGGGVNYVGSFDAAGLSVGEATKRIAAERGFSFKYNATAMGWFVTEIAGVQQNPAQDKYWLYWVSGAFGDVSVDKKILQVGDTLVWQYGS